MQTNCPKCEHELSRSGELKRHCDACDSDFTLEVTCNQCGEQLERLKACGAVNFWCNSCNELKSKSSAVYNLKSA